LDEVLEGAKNQFADTVRSFQRRYKLTSTVALRSNLDAGDWSDFESAHLANKAILDGIARDRNALREFVINARRQPELFSMCEKDQFRYKLVLHIQDAPFARLRLHIWKTGFSDVAHVHRFNYTSRILSGGYRHLVYSHNQNLYPSEICNQTDEFLEADSDLIKRSLDISMIFPTVAFDVGQGQCYSQNYEILSSTVTLKDTVSLFIRGPAYRDSAFQLNVEERKIIWRSGKRTLSSEKQKEISMTSDDFDYVLNRLEELHII
jgi:hypothetical protein